jgi:hypothetical protein
MSIHIFYNFAENKSNYRLFAYDCGKIGQNCFLIIIEAYRRKNT